MHDQELPIPDFFDPDKVSNVWRVPYQERADAARQWAHRHYISNAAHDRNRIGLLLVDVQNTFCIPGFELYVGGESGTGAVDDNQRLCEFIYRNLNRITQICPTLDTHKSAQIFHSLFLVNKAGDHPGPYALISAEEIDAGVWRVNPALLEANAMDEVQAENFLRHYAQTLKASGKYDLTIWPYHAMLGGIGHALVAAVEEAIFFHTMARQSQPDMQIKGGNPLTENYSILRPEVLTDADGRGIAHKNKAFIKKLLDYDALIIAGQAKSHCVAWTVQDLLDEIVSIDPKRAGRVYLLEDCTSPVVIPDVINYAGQADEAFQRFAQAGMHIVQSTEPVTAWSDFPC
jgi:nicotinamidase-related amidase